MQQECDRGLGAAENRFSSTLRWTSWLGKWLGLARYTHWTPSKGSHAANFTDKVLRQSLLLPYCCQVPSSMIVGSSLFIGFAGKKESRRADSNR